MNTILFRAGIGIYLVLGIFYVFPAGSPQPADFMIAALLVAAIAARQIRLDRDATALMVFVVYSFGVNAVWAFLIGSMTLYLSSIYLAYNLLIFVLIQRFAQGSTRNLKIILWASMIALVLEIFFILTTGSVRARAIGTFTNPNQLSYFAICFTGMAMLTADRLRMPIWVTGLALGLGWLVVIFGLSKAAIGAMVLLTAFTLLHLRKPVYTLGAVIAGAFVIRTFFWDQVLLAWARMNTIGQDSDDSLAGRGYDRIFNEAEYLLFGAGEGAYRRHDSLWGGEIHSTFGTILFCYGIIGLVLFAIFITPILWRRRWEAVQFVLPLFAYSVTHQGMRFTPFWVLLALVAAAPPVIAAKGRRT